MELLAIDFHFYNNEVYKTISKFSPDGWFTDLANVEPSIRIFGTQEQIEKALNDYIELTELNLKELPYVKFGGGWFNVFSSNLLKFIDVPDSLSSYGLDDTFVGDCSNLMKQKGYDISQYILDNVLVCENRKYRDLNPYNSMIEDLTIDESFKQKYRDNAQKHYPIEIEKFKNRL